MSIGSLEKKLFSLMQPSTTILTEIDGAWYRSTPTPSVYFVMHFEKLPKNERNLEKLIC